MNFFRRILYASKYYNVKYLQILLWGFKSREDTNYTYQITPENIAYLAHTVAVVTGMDYGTISKYIEEAANDDALKKAIVDGTRNSKLHKYADPEARFGRRLGWYAFVRALKPKIVVETGVDKGLGSILLCAAILKNKQEGFEGKYFGTDINPNAGYLLSGDYKEVGEILFGDSIESLSRLAGPIDLFINDSDHSADYEYMEYQAIREKLSGNAVILGDNAHCTDKLAVFSTETNRNFLFFKEEPANHWYPGGGIGISFSSKDADLSPVRAR